LPGTKIDYYEDKYLPHAIPQAGLKPPIPPHAYEPRPPYYPYQY